MGASLGPVLTIEYKIDGSQVPHMLMLICAVSLWLPIPENSK